MKVGNAGCKVREVIFSKNAHNKKTLTISIKIYELSKGDFFKIKVIF